MASGIDHKSFELEAAAASTVARSSTVLGFFAKAIPAAGGAALAGYLLYGSFSKEPASLVKPDGEEFHTAQFPAPGLAAERPQTNLGRQYIPPPAPEVAIPPPVPPPAMLPPTPLSEIPLPAPPPPLPAAVATGNDETEARRLAELERLRLAEEERRKWERLKAPQIVADNSDAAGAGNRASGPNGASLSASEREEDPNRRFLATAGSAGVEVSVAGKLDRPDALVTAGTMIRGELITAIQSDLPGMVKAVTSEDVWSFDGRRILIEKGSQLIGEYKSGLSQGQTRVFIVWTRVIGSGEAGAYSVQLGSIGTDSLGRSGNTGFIDNHYVERFGSAILLSVVGGGAQYIASLGQGQSTPSGTSTSVFDPATGQTITTTTQPVTSQNQARQIAAQQVSQTLTQLAQDALKNSLNIAPTVYVDQGTRINVFVKRDLDFSAFYADPVQAALKEIRRERTPKAASRLSR